MLSAAADIAPRVRARAQRRGGGDPGHGPVRAPSAASAAPAASRPRASGRRAPGSRPWPGRPWRARPWRSPAGPPTPTGRTRAPRPRPRGTAAARAPPRPPARPAGPRPPASPAWPRGPSTQSPDTAGVRQARPVASAKSSPIDTIEVPASRSTSPSDRPPRPRATRAAAGTIPATAPTSSAPAADPRNRGQQQQAPLHRRAEQPVRGGLRHRDGAAPQRVAQANTRNTSSVSAAVSAARRRAAAGGQPRRGGGWRSAPVGRDDQQRAAVTVRRRGHRQVGPVGGVANASCFRRRGPGAAPAAARTSPRCCPGRRWGPGSRSPQYRGA